MKTIALRAPPYLGDETVFTGVVRDLHLANPNLKLVVTTPNPGLWVGNPHVAEVIRGRGDGPFPWWRDYLQRDVHYLEAYLRQTCARFGLEAEVTAIRGDVYPEPGYALPFALPERYWLIVPGCKSDVPVKGWGTSNYQAVVDALRGRVEFVSLGLRREWIPELKGVTDLVGRTSVRDLVHLVQRCAGVLCPITSLMHLAAAAPGRPRCVVIAGGRENPVFFSYEGHTVLHAVGGRCALAPCGHSRLGRAAGGCPHRMTDGQSTIARCMAEVSRERVVEAIVGNGS